MAAKKKPKTLGKHISRDVELCRTTNHVVSSQLIKMLIEYEVPFTQNWKRVPFFKRMAYKGAREVCVVSTHCTQYSRARKVVDQMDHSRKKQIIFHAV
ncbi:MAG: hypothetical protein IJ567_12065 [Lachnospiraceae bacterium]|nr:hypothetical protein [Lachnospiraceae bacterium]